MRLFKRGPSQLERQLAAAALDDAMARVQPVPPRIYNPDRGARSHYRDPGQAAARPVCNASGARWAEGDGGLGLCGLCPHIWAQRQGGSDEKSGAVA